MFIVLQNTMTQRLFSAFLLLGPTTAPREREEAINVLFYVWQKDRLTGRKTQDAYNDVQKACSTLFLSVPIAMPCEFVAVVLEMAA